MQNDSPPGAPAAIGDRRLPTQYSDWVGHHRDVGRTSLAASVQPQFYHWQVHFLAWCIMEDEDDLAIVHGKGEHNDQGLCRKDLISPTVDVYGIMPKWKWITNANSFKTYAVPEIKDKTELKYHFWDRCYNLSIEIRVMQDISTLASLATHRSP